MCAAFLLISRTLHCILTAKLQNPNWDQLLSKQQWGSRSSCVSKTVLIAKSKALFFNFTKNNCSLQAFPFNGVKCE